MVRMTVSQGEEVDLARTSDQDNLFWVSLGLMSSIFQKEQIIVTSVFKNYKILISTQSTPL